MSHKRASPPVVNLEPVTASPEELVQHAWAVGLPDGACVLCYRLGPLEALDRRLAGVCWEVLGCEVDVTGDIPPYYFLRIEWLGSPIIQLQIWRWRIYPLHPPAFAELRWYPDQEPFVHLCHLSGNPAQRRLQDANLNKYVNATLKIYPQGRTIGTGMWRTREDFLREVVPIVRRCWQEPPHAYPTAPRIAQMLQMLTTKYVTSDTLRYQCRTHLGTPWNTFVQDIRNNELP
jgi:hypothetical protein